MPEGNWKYEVYTNAVLSVGTDDLILALRCYSEGVSVIALNLGDDEFNSVSLYDHVEGTWVEFRYTHATIEKRIFGNTDCS